MELHKLEEYNLSLLEYNFHQSPLFFCCNSIDSSLLSLLVPFVRFD